MVSLEEALAQIRGAITPLSAERVALRESAGRFASDSITSPMDLPRFDNSAMDGYAVRAADLTTASPDRPVGLVQGEYLPAGVRATAPLPPETCARLFTGSPLPSGADSVVMQEDAELDSAQPSRVIFREAARPWENVRLRGEDVKSGEMICSPGRRITSSLIGLLGAVGIETVNVHRRPVLGVLSTGNELVEPGQPLGPGQIYESNRHSIEALLSEAGAVIRIWPLVADTLAATRSALVEAFADCDAVVSTGGVSVGELDFVKRALTDLGGSTEFWRLAIKPGKPFLFGRVASKILFGLPGNPVSAFVTAMLVVRPAVWRWQGSFDDSLRTIAGRLIEPLVNRGDRRHFMRVQINQSGEVRSAGLQSSHALGSLARADGLVDVGPETVVPAGELVRVLTFD